MKQQTIGETACREYLLEGHKLTNLEASLLFGVGNPYALISRLRKEGYVFKSETCTYAAVLVRLNKYINLTAPENLPIREVFFRQYWINK